MFKILVVEDNRDLNRSVCAFLDRNGYEAAGCLSALEAYDAMHGNTFDAIISDIVAAINVVKFRRHGSPVLSAAKAIHLAAALVSILALETAMLSQFGGADDVRFRETMTAATGGGICAVILGMAVFMIVWSTKGIRRAEIRDH